MTITMWSEWVRRTHRSHKPYGKNVDENFKKAFVTAWKKNQNYEKICQEIADQTQGILEHTLQNQTYICCIMEKKVWIKNQKA